MKLKRYRKSSNSRPELTPTDRTIYTVLMILSVAVPFVLLFLLLYMRPRIAYSVSGTVAVAEENSQLLCLPLLFFLFLCPLCVLHEMKNRRIPIFGERYTHYAWGEEPIFSKDKHPNPAQRIKTRRRVFAFCIAFVLLLALAIPSIFTRTTITEDQRICRFNAFNIQTSSRPLAQSEAVTVRLFRVIRRGSNYYELSFKVQPENREFRMTDAKDTDQFLNDLFMLKMSLPKDKFKITGERRADKLIADRSLTPMQAAQLYALFDKAAP